MTRQEAHRIFNRLRAQFAAKRPALGKLRLVLRKRHFLRHPKPRDLAWYDERDGTVSLMEAALAGPSGRVEGLLAHELGHALDADATRPYAERRADTLAKRVLGVPVRYDDGDVQNLSRGVTPRPARLHENREPEMKRNPPQPDLFAAGPSTVVSKSKLVRKPAWLREAVGLIGTAYAPIGGHANLRTPADLRKDDANVYAFEDIDADLEPDVLQVSKRTPYGLKTVAMGHDGTKEAKRRSIAGKASDFTQFGNYGEVSGRLAEIMLEIGVPVVGDPRIVQKVLNKKIEWVGRDPAYPKVYGWYERSLGGKMHRKILVGMPNLVRNPNEYTKAQYPYEVYYQKTAKGKVRTGSVPVASMAEAKECVQGMKRSPQVIEAFVRKRNPAKGYKMPEAQARHTAEGLLARMKADGADTFAKKVVWVKKHIPSIDRPRTFVGWVTKGERGRVVYQRPSPRRRSR